MKQIEEVFGGANAEEQNVLLHIIKERGYEFFEKTPKTTMTVCLLEDLHKLGYKISVMQSDYTPDMIAKHLKWDSYDHMKINEEHIEPQFKEAINMIFCLCKLEVPFYSA